MVMKSQKAIARTFGIFFLLAFLSYGIGSGMATSITDAPDSLANLYQNSNQIVIGVILMALIHTFVNIGLPVLMLPILKPYNKILSYGYLSAGITATIVVLLGSIFLALHVPLSELYNGANTADRVHFETIATLLSKGNFYAYQLGMALWGIGGIMFCYLLYISKIVPRVLPIWGVLGYLVFIAGTIAEIFGYPIGVQLAIPGGLFEIALSIWLLIKGFRNTELGTA